MKNFISSIMLCCSVIMFQTCHKDSPVTLAVDFSSQDSWKYEFSATIGGNFSWDDSVSNLASTIHTLLAGYSKKERDQLTVKAEEVSITSNVLEDAEIENITELIKDAEYTISLSSGFPNLSDSAIVPVSGFGEWDLYRQLVKVLPTLPEKPVRPGFSWERDRQFPLTTSQGKTTCDIYQSYTFDSLHTASDNRQEAHISWLFRYAIDQKQFDTLSQIGDLPLAGNGKGTAVLDVNGKSLISAEMVFTTPACSLSNVSVGWEEKASLVLVND